jgi:peptide/nickel transport system substrate-binding protein
MVGIPWCSITHAINGALTRPADTEQGWEYYMATSHKQVSHTIYDFDLRSGVQFQDGTPFNADSVIENVEAWKKKPFLFTKLNFVLKGAEKLGPYKVRIHLKERYGAFMNDVKYLLFYSSAYLKKFGWNGKTTCPTTAEPGPYGLGPFVLKSGYFEGDRFSQTAVLEANPRYFDKREPKVERITVHLTADSARTKDAMMAREGVMDIMPIPFDAKVETLMSKHNVLKKTPSTNNFAVQINMINGNPKLLDREIRIAMNKALNQTDLLSYTMDGEGTKTSTFASHLFPGVSKHYRDLPPYGDTLNRADPKQVADLKGKLNGLKLTVYTPDSMMFIWRGVKFQMEKFGVQLDIKTSVNITDVLNQLLSTRAKKNTLAWDLIGWELDDWYGKHPWSAILLYRTSNPWSTIATDKKLDGLIDKMFRASVGTAEFDGVVGQIVRHVYDNAYMLFLPTPNKVLAVNAEVIYKPWSQVSMPLWDIQVSANHWSLRKPATARVAR